MIIERIAEDITAALTRHSDTKKPLKKTKYVRMNQNCTII
jgi:hypothetical protein